jgi:hypothetical protein
MHASYFRSSCCPPVSLGRPEFNPLGGLNVEPWEADVDFLKDIF